MKLKILSFLIFPALFFSCMTAPKNLAYFQDLDKYQNSRIGYDSLMYETVIKKYDELLITVTAPAFDQTTVAQFNLPMTAYLSVGEGSVAQQAGVQQSAAVQTYIVEHDGTINYPVIGRIPLAGLTKSQAIESIKKLVSGYISADPLVTMKIMSFKITVLGEVYKPGTFSINEEKISIIDAIGRAGDLTIFANRENILLIRENDNGTFDKVYFDLTKSDIFTSPYFYLQQNDKIIVEPNRTRQSDSKFGAADGYRLSIFSMLFSAVSIIASTTVAIISIRNRPSSL